MWKIEKVDGDKVGIWDGIAYILCEPVGKTIYKTAQGYEDETFLTLNDCLKEIGYEGGVCIVILETYTSGMVYEFNNYGDRSWYTHGHTVGFV